MSDTRGILDMPGTVSSFGGGNPGVTVTLSNGWRVRIDNMTQDECREWAAKYFMADARVRVDVFSRATPTTEGKETRDE